MWDDQNFEVNHQPSKSPDLNCCDYWLWSEMNKSYLDQISTKVGDLDDESYRDARPKKEWFRMESDELLELIERAAAEIPEEDVNRAMLSLNGRMQKCLKIKGGRFENRRDLE